MFNNMTKRFNNENKIVIIKIKKKINFFFF